MKRMLSRAFLNFAALFHYENYDHFLFLLLVVLSLNRHLFIVSKLFAGVWGQL